MTSALSAAVNFIYSSSSAAQIECEMLEQNKLVSRQQQIRLRIFNMSYYLVNNFYRVFPGFPFLLCGIFINALDIKNNVAVSNKSHVDHISMGGKPVCVTQNIWMH